WIGVRALADDQWHIAQRTRLVQASVSLRSALQSILRKEVDKFLEDSARFNHVGEGATHSGHGLTLTGRELLVNQTESAHGLYSIFLTAADQRILLRFGQTAHGRAWLRIGLPGSSADTFKTLLAPVFSANF